MSKKQILKGLFLVILFGLFTYCEQADELPIAGIPGFTPPIQNRLDATIIGYNVSSEPNRSDSLFYYSLGIYEDPIFGTVKSSIALNYSLNGTDVSFGERPVLDSVILNFPLVKRRDSTALISGNRDGNQYRPFNMKIYEITKQLTADSYNSDHQPQIDQMNTIFEGIISLSQDSIPINDSTKIAPSLRIKLDQRGINFFRNKIISKSGKSELSKDEAFKNHFRGLYLTATSDDGSIASFNVSTSSLTLHYRNSEGQQTYSFVHDKGSRAFNRYELIQSEDIKQLIRTPPDTIRGEPVLYAQGLNGVHTKLKLLTNEQIKMIRDNNWVINEARLTITPVQESDEPSYPFPESLSLSNPIESPISSLDNVSLARYDSEKEEYIFQITRRVHEIVYEDAENILNLNVSGFLYSPFRVVLNGNRASNPMKLEIFYTETITN